MKGHKITEKNNERSVIMLTGLIDNLTSVHPFLCSSGPPLYCGWLNYRSNTLPLCPPALFMDSVMPLALAARPLKCTSYPMVGTWPCNSLGHWMFSRLTRSDGAWRGPAFTHGGWPSGAAVPQDKTCGTNLHPTWSSKPGPVEPSLGHCHLPSSSSRGNLADLGRDRAATPQTFSRWTLVLRVF